MIVVSVYVCSYVHGGKGWVERRSMRQYASTHLKKYNKIRISTGQEEKGADIVTCAVTEIPIQMWATEMQFLQSSAFCVLV